MPRRNRYDDAFDTLWADEAAQPRKYSEFEEEEAAVKIQAAIRGRQTRREIAGQKNRNQKKRRKSKKKRKDKKKTNQTNDEFIKTNTLSELERKVAELEQKHSAQETKPGFFSGARKRVFGNSPKQVSEPVNHRKLRQEREEAARKIQAIQRGEIGRRNAMNRKKELQQREETKRQVKEQLRREKEERIKRNRERNAMYEERRKARQQKRLVENQLTEENKKKRRNMAEKRRKNNKKNGDSQKMLTQQRMLQYDAIISLFNTFDSDGGGTISMYEVKNMCQHMSQSKQVVLPFEEELEDTISLMTKNRSLTNISRSQFEDWIGQIISMSGKQIAGIKNTSPFHQRYANLILVCRDWLDNVMQSQSQQLENKLLDDGLSPRQRRQQESLRRQQEEEMSKAMSTIKIGSDAAAERHREIMEKQQAKELARKHYAELKQKERNEAENYRAQQLKDHYKVKQEIAKQNSRRIDAIHRYRQEEHAKKLEAIDKAKQELMEKKGYAVQGVVAQNISNHVTSSQLLGMSTSPMHYNMSLPKKKQRVITEYYPGQQEVHSINQVEADISHWLFMENEQNLEDSNAMERSIFLSQSPIRDLSESGDWEDWNDDTESLSLMQQGSSLMSKQPENSGYATESISMESNASDIKIIFDFYTNNGNSRRKNARPLMPRTTFINFVDSLNLPVGNRQFLRRQAALVYNSLTKEANCIQMDFNIYQKALFEISKFLYNSPDLNSSFNRFSVEYMKKAAKAVQKREKISNGTFTSIKSKVRSPTLGGKRGGKRGSPKNKFIRNKKQ